MRARFGISSRLQYYTAELLTTIVERSASIKCLYRWKLLSKLQVEEGTPRIANAATSRVRDFAQIKEMEQSILK
jgi:Holliday junction DNA helicase RuvB